MHGVRMRLTRGLEQRRNVEVALTRVRRADADRLVGVTHVERVLVRGRVDRDRGEIELTARPQHPDGDLAPVRDEDLAQRRSARGLM